MSKVYPQGLIREVQVENLTEKHGNLKEYLKQGDHEEKRLQRCSLGQYFGTAGSLKTIQVLQGAEGKLCGESYSGATPDKDFGYCPDRVRGYASKLSAVCDDVSSSAGKTLVLVHSSHGFKLMLRLLEARFPNDVLGYLGGNPSVTVKWDDEIRSLIGEKHSDADKAKGECGCNICRFNDPKANLEGEAYRIIVADAKFCSEGYAQDTLRIRIWIRIRTRYAPRVTAPNTSYCA